MADPLPLLASWLSPAFPVGAFTYSHGLETAVAQGQVHDIETARSWIEGVLRHGAGWSDALLLLEAMRRSVRGDGLEDLIDLALALAPSAERRLESEAQGRAFAETVAPIWGGLATAAPYPIAFGRAAAGIAAPQETTVCLFLNAFAGNLVSAGQRLVPLGQVEAQKVIADLQPVCETLAKRALAATLDDIGGHAFLADIASLRHETQEVRLFRS